MSDSIGVGGWPYYVLILDTQLRGNRTDVLVGMAVEKLGVSEEEVRRTVSDLHWELSDALRPKIGEMDTDALRAARRVKALEICANDKYRCPPPQAETLIELMLDDVC